MNTSIMIKGADFSKNNVGKLKLQKLEVIKAGNGCILADDNGQLVVKQSFNNWNPSNELAYSQEITLPNGAAYLFGTFSNIFYTEQFNDDGQFNVPNSDGNYQAYGPSSSTFWSFYCSTGQYAGQWRSMYYVVSKIYNKPRILAKKDGLYANGSYSAVKICGAIYGSRFFKSHGITKMRINWLKPESIEAPEIGMVVPELYVGIEE